MAAILFVRIKSGLDAPEFERLLVERRPRFHEVPGLVQKIYGRDDETGDVCGIYFFESNEALAAFRESELAQTIPAAYEALDVRREVYEVLYPLLPERGAIHRVRSHGGGAAVGEAFGRTGSRTKRRKLMVIRLAARPFHLSKRRPLLHPRRGGATTTSSSATSGPGSASTRAVTSSSQPSAGTTTSPGARSDRRPLANYAGGQNAAT
jgi:putative monooxygenase ydhR